MIKRSLYTLLVMLLISWSNGLAQQSEPTRLVVRAKAKDAKFIGTSMGGVAVAVRNSQTGALMAQGTIEGSTGSTDVLMKSPWERETRLSEGGAAKFDTTLMLEQPTLVTIEAKGPLGQPQSSILTSTEVWLIPGKDIEGDGIILDFPGFAVDLLEPRAHSMVESGEKVSIRANIVMMCGCPTRPGGLWNSDDYRVEAWIKKDEEIVEKVSLSYGGQTSLYKGTFSPDQSGTYTVTLVAYDTRSHNTGVDRTTFIYD